MYKYKNYTYSLEEVQDAADKEKLSIDEYIKEFNIEKTDPDPDEEGKETPSQETESAAVKESVALEPTVTESVSEDTFLDSQKIKTPEVKTGTAADTTEINKIKEKTSKELEAELKSINDQISLIAGKDMEIDALDSPNRIKEFNQLSIEKNKIKRKLGQETNKGEGVILDLYNDLKEAAFQGYSRGDVVDPSFKLFSLGGDASDQQVLDLINAKKDVASKAMQSDEMRAFDETYEKTGGGFLGFMLGAAENPSIVPAMLISSVATQIGTVTKSEDARQRFAQGVIGGGVIGSSIPVIGTAAGAIGGGFFAAAGTMETALTFADLLEEEIGEELTVDNVRAILEDPVKLEDLQNRALGRGLAIATIETATGALAKGVGSTLVKKGFTPIAVTGSAAGLDIVGGGVGEVAGMTLAKQPYDIKEIGFEMITPGFSSAIGLASLKNITELTNQNKINNIIKPTEYTNISYAFDPIEQTTEAQINIAQIPGSEKILDRNVKREISKGNITQEQGNAIKLNFRETQGTTNQIKSLKLNEQDQATTVQLIKEKKQLKNQIEQVGEPNLTIEQSDRIKQIDEDLKGINSKAVTQQVEKVKEAAKDITDLDIQEFATTAETEAFLNEQDQNVKASSQQGFIIQNKDGKQTIVINREVADKEIAVAAPAHEFLHAILYKTVKDSPNTALQLGNSLMEYIGKIDINQVKDSNFAQRLQQYQDQSAEVQAEEALTLFSDAILTGDIKFKENIFTKLRDVISKILQVGGVKARFDTGRDVYNFIKDYNKNIQEGKLTSQQIRTAEEGVKLDIQEPAVKQAETVVKESRSEKASQSVLEAVNKLVPQDITTQEEYQSFVNDRRAFPKLYRAITEQGGVINNYIKSISTTPEEAQKTIENLTNRILKFNPEAKRKGTKKAVGIEAFGERIFADIQFARKGSKLELYEESEKTKRESRREDREDGFETLAAPETEIEVAETKPTERLIEVKNKFLSPESRTAFEENIASRINELAPDEFTFKKLPNWGKEDLAKELNIPLKKFEGSSNFTQAELGRLLTWIETNVSDIRRALPGAAVLEGASVPESLIGTATGVPNNLLKNINLYERLARGTKDAGLVPYRKLKGIDNSSILKAVSIIDGRQMAGPRDKAAQTAKGIFNMMAKVMTNQEIRKQLQAKPRPDITTKETESARAGGIESRLLFSLSIPAKKLLNKFKIEDKYNGLDTKTGINLFVKDIEKYLIPYFSKEDFKVLNKSILNFKTEFFNPKEENVSAVELQKYLTAKLDALKPKFRGMATVGRTPYNNPYSFGKTPQNVESRLKNNGKWVKDFNTKQRGVFNKMILDMNKAYKETDGAIALPLVYLLENGQNERSNPFPMGAAVLGFYPNAESYTYKNKKGKEITGYYLYEHSFPVTQASRLILEGIFSKNKTTFNNNLKRVQDNFYVLALTKEDDVKIQKYAKENEENLTKALPENERWWDRYEKANIDLTKYTSYIEGFDTIQDIVNAAKAEQQEPKVLPLYNILGQSEIQASKSNNNKLPKSQQLPSSYNKNNLVLAKMQELDDEANKARIKYSKSQDLNEDFNNIIEAKTGIATYKRFSPAKAQVRGASKGKFNFFIPPSAEDFTGLLYKTLAKGKVGDTQMQWYKDNLLDPYARAMNDISAARVAMFEDYKALKNDLEIIPKNLKKKSVDEYTREQAVRVYIWNDQGNNVPGLFKTDQKDLVDYVNKDSELKLFAEQLIAIQKNDEYSAPKEGWLAGSITTDLLDNVNSIKRKKYLEQWQTNVDLIFSEENMNKLEAAFGKPYVKALENILTRMKTGRNKPFTSDSLAGRVTDWLNNSVGAIMFFNTRSAVLQTISSINFVNWSDNNIYQAGKALANQPQYWKDFKFLFNSDFLKERRGGLRFNVSESEIADAAKKGGARGVVSKILQAGFLPTQAADSFAIASGGATFYRNRIKSYIKKGLTETEAQEKAFLDFREIAEESQQSSRPDRISAQQAGPLGRTILAFANTPAQYARLTKKAASDLINRRGDAKTNISKLLYYGFVQNLVFNMLQKAVFMIAFGDDDEDEKKKEEKYLDVANGMADGLLRGMGIQGAIASTLKNTLIKIIKESKKARPDYAETALIQLLSISPPIQSKAQKVRSALKSYEWNKDEMLNKGFSLDNPAYMAGANVISAFTNVPLDRVVKKVNNIAASTQEDISPVERSMLVAGWSEWELGIQKPKKKKKKKTRSSGRGTSRSNSRSSNRR